jgi:hypothetical protein
MQSQLAADKKTFIALVSDYRLVVYDRSGQVVPMSSPVWGASGPPKDIVGITYSLQFVGPNLLHDISPANEGGPVGATSKLL